MRNDYYEIHISETKNCDGIRRRGRTCLHSPTIFGYNPLIMGYNVEQLDGRLVTIIGLPSTVPVGAKIVGAEFWKYCDACHKNNISYCNRGIQISKAEFEIYRVMAN